MTERIPALRRDLEFFPVTHEGQRFILIKDHLGLVKEGMAVGFPLYQVMALLDGTGTMRDLQMTLMRQKGGVIVETDEVQTLISSLDASFLLDSENFRKARDEIVSEFVSKGARPCSHCGRAYPADPSELKTKLDEILGHRPAVPETDGKVRALVAPHIDLAVGGRVYASAYGTLKDMKPSTVVILGVGHGMGNELFSVTDKDYETPLGAISGDPETIKELRAAGGDAIAHDDFAHRSEHSIEFQAVFLKHLLGDRAFRTIPILCGSMRAGLPDYSRDAFLEKAGPFLKKLRDILSSTEEETLLVAGVDFSHIGNKFGHEMPATNLENQAKTHDTKLLEHLSRLDADRFWEESGSVNDRYNVCGFSALACLLEILPQCNGSVLDYDMWHEAPTRSAVSFAAVVFTG